MWYDDISISIIMLYLAFPNISHKSQYLAMTKEWWDFETIPTSPWALFHWETYEVFLENRKADLISNFFGVPATLLFFMEDADMLWAIQIRHTLDHPDLLNFNGHIGYWLRPSARGKWLSREMLSFWLIEAKKLGIDKVMISAYEENITSWKTIERCGWVLDRIIMKEGKLLKIYRIDNSSSCPVK